MKSFYSFLPTLFAILASQFVGDALAENHSQSGPRASINTEKSLPRLNATAPETRRRAASPLNSFFINGRDEAVYMPAFDLRTNGAKGYGELELAELTTFLLRAVRSGSFTGIGGDWGSSLAAKYQLPNSFPSSLARKLIELTGGHSVKLVMELDGERKYHTGERTDIKDISFTIEVMDEEGKVVRQFRNLQPMASKTLRDVPWPNGDYIFSRSMGEALMRLAEKGNSSAGEQFSPDGPKSPLKNQVQSDRQLEKSE